MTVCWSESQRLDSQVSQKIFNLFKWGIEAKGKQEQQQQLKLFLGLGPMAADKTVYQQSRNRTHDLFLAKQPWDPLDQCCTEALSQICNVCYKTRLTLIRFSFSFSFRVWLFCQISKLFFIWKFFFSFCASVFSHLKFSQKISPNQRSDDKHLAESIPK